MAIPSELMLFQNGNIMAFDDKGEQMPQFQGRASHVLTVLKGVDLTNTKCSFAVWGHAVQAVDQEIFFQALNNLVVEDEVSKLNGN